MNKLKWIAVLFTLVALSGFAGYKVTVASEGGAVIPVAGPLRRAYWRMLGVKTGKLAIITMNATTQKPIPGAGCIVGETGDRVETNNQGKAPVMDAPVFRNPRLERMLAELQGQLTVLCYKDGYRDAVYVGVRMNENRVSAPQVWMYPVGKGDRRIEPTLYQPPFHRLWIIQLADKFRLYEQGKPKGEGPESPALTRPGEGPAPQEPEGLGVQPPPFPAPPWVQRKQ